MFGVRGLRGARAAQGARRLITSAAVEGNLGVSELSLIVKAGSRFEQAPGVAHLLQRFAFKDTKTRSGLRLQREAELLGGSVSAALGKENLVLTAKFLREDLPYFVEALADTVSRPLFKPHEFSEEVVPLAQAEAAKLRSDLVYLAVEGAYEVAFRSGLANSVLVSPENPLSLDSVVSFAEKAFDPASIRLFGRNVLAADLEHFAGKDFADLTSKGSLTSPKSQFFSGEFRVKRMGTEQVAVLAFPTSDKPCLEALKHVLVGRNVKWSPSFGVLNAFPARISAENARFSDASLFYVAIRADSAQVVSEAVKATVGAIKSAASGVDDQVAKKAIASAKFTAAEAGNTLVAQLVPKMSLGKVSAKSIAAAAKSLVEGPHVLSVVGQTHALPYASDLF